MAEARGLIEQGQPDRALEKLALVSSDPDALYYQGVAWAKKAESAPLPTPAPVAASAPRGSLPAQATEFKPEEIQALQFFDKAAAAQPNEARSYLALAELLGPHALRSHGNVDAARKRPAPRGSQAAPEPGPAAVSQGQDFSVDRVVRAYEMAVRNSPDSPAPIEAMIAFATKAGRLDAAEDGYRELIKRETEKPAVPLARYGDFLARDKKDIPAAIEQYSQALIWLPDDEQIRGKIADIYMAMGAADLAKTQYASAEVRFKTAQKYITDRSSPRGLQLQEYVGRIRAIRDGR